MVRKMRKNWKKGWKLGKNWKKIGRKEKNEKCKVKNDWKKLRTFLFLFCFFFLLFTFRKPVKSFRGLPKWKFSLPGGKRLKSCLERIEKSDFTTGKYREKRLCPPRKISLLRPCTHIYDMLQSHKITFTMQSQNH